MLPETPPQTSPGRDEIVLRLLSRLYQACLDRPQWHAFAAELSEALGGPAVTLAIRRPESRLGWNYYGSGSHDLALLVAEDLQGALARAARRIDGFRQGFVDLGEAFPRIVLERNAWFQEWLGPHGVEPDWPLCHAVAVDRTIHCWIIVQRSPNAHFDAALLVALGALLVPHFSRAFRIHLGLSARTHEQRALDEILDRLPLGMMMFDARGRVVHANLSAQRMLSLDDGISMRNDRLRAAGDDAAALQGAIDSAIQAASRGVVDHLVHTTVATRSGRRPFLFAFTPLPRGQAGDGTREPVAVAYFSNPDALSSASVQALEAVYGLTGAEAAIVRGLVEGRSLEEIATGRGVKPNTARSQLKHVFAKTRTKRQAELIRLVLAGVAPISQPGSASEGEAP